MFHSVEFKLGMGLLIVWINFANAEENPHVDLNWLTAKYSSVYSNDVKIKNAIIKAVINLYKIDTTYLDQVTYEADLPAYGVSFQSFHADKIIVEIGPKAFEEGIAVLASTLAHELEAHGPTIAKFGNSMSGTQDEFLDEVYAYDYELRHHQRFGLNLRQREFIQKERDYFFNKLSREYRLYYKRGIKVATPSSLSSSTTRPHDPSSDNDKVLSIIAK